MPLPRVLIARIQAFVDGEDISLAAANDIEVALDDAYPDDERIQDVVLMLASYRPGGGDCLHAEPEMRAVLAKLLSRLA